MSVLKENQTVSETTTTYTTLSLWLSSSTVKLLLKDGNIHEVSPLSMRFCFFHCSLS